MENNYIMESYLNFMQSLMEDEKSEVLEKINSRRKAILEWNRTKQQLGEWTEELEKESKEKLEHLDNMEREVKKMAQNEEEMEMDWKEFANLEEVQVDQSTTGTGNALFYNDENIVVSVEIDGDHDDTSLWEDEELIQELQGLVKAGYADIYSSVNPLSKSGKEVS